MEMEKESLIKDEFDMTNACATIPKIITEFYGARNIGIVPSRYEIGKKLICIKLQNDITLLFQLESTDTVSVKGKLSTYFPNCLTTKEIFEKKQKLLDAIKEIGGIPKKPIVPLEAPTTISKDMKVWVDNLCLLINKLPGSKKKNNCGVKWIDWQNIRELKVVINHKKIVLQINKDGYIDKHYTTPRSFPKDFFGKSFSNVSVDELFSTIKSNCNISS